MIWPFLKRNCSPSSKSRSEASQRERLYFNESSLYFPIEKSESSDLSCPTVMSRMLAPLARAYSACYRISPGDRGCLAQRSEFELPVPISEQVDDNMAGSDAQTKCRDRAKLKSQDCLYIQQHSRRPSPRTMNDIATDSEREKNKRLLCPVAVTT
jgi:hypothetical protein